MDHWAAANRSDEKMITVNAALSIVSNALGGNVPHPSSACTPCYRVPSTGHNLPGFVFDGISLSIANCSALKVYIAFIYHCRYACLDKGKNVVEMSILS